ncbi:peptidase domain-containing ABC transporter [Sphingomonas oryzagri]
MISIASLVLGEKYAAKPVLQNESSGCGLACLANISTILGNPVDIREIRSMRPISMKGTTLRTLIAIASDIGLDGRAFQIELDDLHDLKLPAMLHWNLSHFVVLLSITRRRGSVEYRIIDPLDGYHLLDRNRMSQSYTGVCAEFTKIRNYVKSDTSNKLRLFDVVRRTPGLSTSLLKVFSIALMVQFLMFVGPLFLQIAVDQIVPSDDLPLLLELGGIFLATSLAVGIGVLFRGALVLIVGLELSYRLSIDLTRHLLSLRAEWFGRRTVADLLSRLASVQPVSDYVGKQMISTVISALGLLSFSLVTAIYSLPIFAVTVTTTTLFIAVKLFLANTLAKQTLSVIRSQARESSALIENIRGVTAIKAFSAEADRFELWADLKTKCITDQAISAKTQNWIDALQPFFTAVDAVIFTVTAVYLVICREMTIGMIFAVSIYRSQVLASAIALTDAISGYRLANVHSERLGDILLEAPDLRNSYHEVLERTQGHVAFKNVSFSYGSGEDAVLKDVSFDVAPGESIAITGPSGCGKSTTLKIILGFLEPIAGSVIVDGKPLRQSNIGEFRRGVGYVAQGDHLFDGSIADNIAFFGRDRDIGRIIEAAKLAMISDDIDRMPMRYETLVGDMGSSLSGGQKARILMARALYRRPGLLLVDEGSAHLDLKTETMLNESIRRLGMTRIIVAHRRETILSADRIYHIDRGIIQEVSREQFINGRGRQPLAERQSRSSDRL